MSRETEEAGARLILEGRVQGVGFRFFTQRRATALGLRGWVRNLPDGTVEAEAWGPSAALAEFKDELRGGPAGSRVTAIRESTLDKAEERSRFEIIY